MNQITCASCGAEIQIDKALEGQIEDRVLAAERHKHSQELEAIRAEQSKLLLDATKEAEAITKKEIERQKTLLAEQVAADLAFEKQKLTQEAANQQRLLETKQSTQLQNLEADAATAKADALAAKAESDKLRKELSELMKLLREEKLARSNAELEAQKKLAAEEDNIRQEALKSADEKFRLKSMEQEKKIADMQKSLDEAQRKAAQGSQQNQGEVLELTLETKLKEEFPFDEITEVKKGQRGADIIQTVRNQSYSKCGILLWETKNGKWQPAWVAKFKQDIREAGASIGVIVSQETPPDYGDMKAIDAAVWVVKPRLAVVLASALRGTILQVDVAHRNNQGKDAKMEALYQFLVGPEFKHRVEAIVENYGTLQQEIEKEKRSAALRWAHQEKAIRAVIDNTIGMYGDLQGITNRSLPAIRSLEPTDEYLEAPEQPSLLD